MTKKTTLEQDTSDLLYNAYVEGQTAKKIVVIGNIRRMKSVSPQRAALAVIRNVKSPVRGLRSPPRPGKVVV